MTAAEVVELIDRLRRARSCSGSDGHERHLGAARRRRLPGHDEPRRDPVAHGGDRERSLQPADGAGVRRRAAAGRRAADAVRVPQPGRSSPTAACSSSARRRPACSWRPSCRQSGRPVTLVGRRARAAAANVSRPRRPVVDGRVRRVGPALRRGRRSRAGAAAAVAAARRDARANDARPQRAGGDGRRAGGPLGGGP